MDHQSIQLEYEGEQAAHNPQFDMFCDAFRLYVTDLKAHQRWLVWPNTAEADDKGDAWRDFRSPAQKQFNYLCDMTGMDAAAACSALKAQLRAACEGGVQ